MSRVNDDDHTDEENCFVTDQSSPETSSSGRRPKTKKFGNDIHDFFIDVSGDSKCRSCLITIKGHNTTNLKNHSSKHKDQ